MIFMSEFGLDISDLKRKIGEAVKNAVDDLQTLTVITTTGTIIVGEKESTKTPIMKIQETGICAKTIIEIDGDIIVQVPVRDENGKEMVVDERMLQLHEENVSMAMENYRTFITTIFEVAKSVLDLLGAS